jgi:ubiquinone/menaquinone biosynthesis C-methylase UbiE
MDVARSLRIRLKRLAYGGVGGGRDGERVVAWLGVGTGMRVADIGSGFGDFAVRFAAAVGPGGTVYAVDTDADLREEVARTAHRLGLAQLRTVAANDDDPGIPGPVDLVFLSSSFHHLPDRVRYFERIREDLRSGGRVAILEGRPSLFTGWFGHATAPDEVVATLTAAGFRRLGGADIVRFASLQTFVAAHDGHVS